MNGPERWELMEDKVGLDKLFPLKIKKIITHFSFNHV